MAQETKPAPFVVRRSTEAVPFHEFDPGEIERLGQHWDVWPTMPTRPFDRDRCVGEVLAAFRADNGQWLSYPRMDQLLAPFYNVDGLIGREEACFFFSLVTTEDFLRRPSTDPLEPGWVLERASALAPTASAEDAMERLAAVPHFFDAYYWGRQPTRLLRELVPYLDALRFLEEHTAPDRIGYWVWELGPPRTAEEREGALEWVGKLIAGVDFNTCYTDSLTEALPRLLHRIPRDADIVRLLEAHGRRHRRSRAWRSMLMVLPYKLEDKERAFDSFRGLHVDARPEDVRLFYARYGAEHLDVLLKYIVRRNARWGGAVETIKEALKIHHPAMVEPLMSWADHEQVGKFVEVYLLSEGANVIEGLLDLCGRRGQRQTWALSILRRIVERSPEDRELVAQHVELREEALKALLQREVFEHGAAGPTELDEAAWPSWMKELASTTMPEQANLDWVDFGALPPLLLGEGGKRLADPVVRGLLAAVATAASKQGNRDFVRKHPGDKALRRAFESLQPEGFKHFALSLFERWRLVGFPQEGAWTIELCSLIGSRAMASALEHFARGTHDYRARPFAQRAIAGLARVELPQARFALEDMARHLQGVDLRRLARDAISGIKKHKGWNDDDFEDASVPTLGLDSHGCRRLDYGPRAIRLLVKGRDELVLVDEGTGQTYEKLPPAKKGDDREKVAAARLEYKRVRQPLLKVVLETAQRLERGMIVGRRWATTYWLEQILPHPISGHLASRLVWTLLSPTGEPLGLLRPDVDGGCVDVEFGDVEVPEGASVAIAHPADIAQDLRAAWTEHLSDADAIQPFDQLSRPLYSLDAERQALVDELLAGKQAVALEALTGALDLGWTRSGSNWWHADKLTLAPRGLGQAVQIKLRWGISVSREGVIKHNRLSDTVEALSAFRQGAEGQLNDPIPLAEVRPMLISEVFHVLYRSLPAK